MRKILISISLIWLFTCLVSPVGIQIFKPSKNEVVLKKADYTIRWTTIGKAINKVKIRLFDKTGTIKLTELTNSTPNTGLYLWNQQSIKTYPTGSYVIRVKTTDNLLYGNSAPFQIGQKEGPPIGIIQVKTFKPPSKAHRHRAPAIEQPSNASFNIKKIHYGVNKNGRIDAMWVVVGYNSKTPFSFSKYQGHSKDGPAYMNCKILIPYWPEDSNYKGPFKTKAIFNHRLSVKYKGQNNLKCEPEILNAGTGEFELIFSPAHSGKVEWLYTKQRMPKGNPWQGHTDYCTKTYQPKMALRLFIHTKEGVRQVYKEFYLGRGTKGKSITIPGEVNICTGGNVYW